MATDSMSGFTVMMEDFTARSCSPKFNTFVRINEIDKNGKD
jgi:hypothetical protein